jgi:hypothetical protein
MKILTQRFCNRPNGLGSGEEVEDLAVMPDGEDCSSPL